MTGKRRSGLTLVEVLVAIAVVVVGIGLLLPVSRNVRDASGRMQCSNHLGQLLLAMHQYEDTHRQPAIESANVPSWAAPVGFPTGCFGPGSQPEDRLSWMVAILPYLEQESLYRAIDPEAGYFGNFATVEVPIPILQCRSRDRSPSAKHVTHYVAMAGLGADAATHPARTPTNGWMGYDRITTRELISDGTSNTIALVETASDLGPWARGGQSTLRGYVGIPALYHQIGHASFVHSNGLIVGMGDGSIRTISHDIAPERLAAAMTIAGDELVFLE
ncbi:Uncharacterized protein OS=Planctomyces brasiliensis (strain ATCC 49424 / DSM 5305 / JCM 21570 / NBRC 103401 / IFAM 1448) GN=Plabr_4569 PE=4 SV=1: SBP_bac_10 [Tuwongella immobilis]|uniref:DUF1559 domain-containing protein n=2 Tax=Tuwongella immobilis TaxID=692036 RepID=A0A6C2YJH8_9BACT|nr:Uncharacterized protein OS=Planctomyces brasiliensis (strain ATCC 49424 / DSM 5305 / JCM 21570 / NBRC 103401 / IFAM 1448) GN=Plabr_4569 PE=4 SV=1: SBP_bac_10 [Tuwongella immobilis]VTR98673.1 Uncharacterized protein OS=Planctomyces brasiliensis (strain ATCC 49424 / DSM 5305 / JCM 21570 / NBRC 103401 / IFAM 1448) GN=Plabr_4569 PE=4 SV=1: SBP_bac_10 [Tuwongella immobilis]